MWQIAEHSDAPRGFVKSGKALSQSNPFRKRSKRPLALIFAVCLFWLPQCQSPAQAAVLHPVAQIAPGAQGKLAVAGAQNATLYATPGGKVVQTLLPGTTLTAYGRTGDSKWVIIRTDSNVTGWVLTEQLVIFGMDDLPILTDAPPTPATTITPKVTPGATTSAAKTPVSTALATQPTATIAPPTATSMPTATPMPTATLPPTASPTPRPTATPSPVPSPTLAPTTTTISAPNMSVNPIGIVGGNGADLVKEPNGALVKKLDTGTVLTTNGRSTDSAWLYVSTTDGATGWVAANQVVAFGVDNLPVVNHQGAAVANSQQPGVDGQTPISTTATTTGTAVTTDTVTKDTVTKDTAPAQPAPPVTAVTAAPPAPAADGRPTARVSAASRINVRSGPGTTYPIITKLQPNQTVVALARNQASTWVQIELTDGANGFGWVSADLVQLSKAIADLPVSDRIGTPPAATPTPQDVGAQPASPSAQSANVQTVNNTAVNNPVVQSTGPTGLNGHLVIESTWGGAIYVYDLASGSLRLLTGGFDPEISPDGTQVAFTRDGNDGGVYVINLDGSNEHRVFGERDQLRSPKWSPDGKSIVFSRSEGTYGCYNLGPYCKSSTQIFPIPAEAPPAKKKALEELRAKILKDFDKDRRSNFMIASVSTDGSNFRDIAALNSARAPDWSAGGITYSSPAGIQKTDDKPGAQNSLVTADNNMMDPDWQPGGGRIIYQIKQGSHWEIFGVNPDGSGLAALTRPVTTLVDHLPSNVSPAWSPDGQQIVYLSNRDANNDVGAWRVWVMNADGSNQHPLVINLPITYNFVAEQMVSWGK